MNSATSPISAAEPIAVIGMSARMPGAADIDQFWQLLRTGGDAVTEVPPGRWPDADVTEFRRGGFLSDVDRFDAAFFDLAPAEAAAMDPQQRLLLELSWHALEHSRIAPDTVSGTGAGVFVGVAGSDYAVLHDRLRAGSPGPYALTGGHRSLIANRVSFTLGLRGPSLTLDTGQSSSLVAVQLACEQLSQGTLPLALAGGVNLTLLGQPSAALGEFGALSPDGRCYTFDHRANGFVRGEGGAVIVLKPLSAAQRDGDQVHAVILGGATNNDGGGDGLAAPRREAQEDVIRLACRQAGVAPAEVQYVELHGTGTRAGDPVEAAALGAVLGAARPDQSPLLVGSAKTNIGHLEGAAGIAGLLKVILSIKHRELPPSLNFERPNPAIPLDQLNLDVVQAARDWPAPHERLVAGVSSFGMGGTNCHLLLSAGDPVAGPAADPAIGPAAGGSLMLSARSAPALRAQAARLAGCLTGSAAARAADVALSLARTRARLPYRAVIGSGPADELAARLGALADGKHDDGVFTGTAVDGTDAFVFPGQGSQWPGLAAALLSEGEEPEFRARLDECVQAVQPFLDYQLLDVLSGAAGAADLNRTDVVQPALWAVMVSLAELWRAHGVTPGTLIGHSQGEVAAATVAGALSVTDAARVVALRSQLARDMPGMGMLSVAAAPAELARWTQPTEDVSVAALNGPHSTVLSGSLATLSRLEASFTAAGYRTKLLPVRYPSHSPAMDQLRDQLLAALAPIRPVSTPRTFISTVTGRPVDTAGLDPEYWFRNLREPVQFAAAVRYAITSGCGRFIECSPHPLLTASVEEIAEEAGRDAAAVGTLERGDGGGSRVARSLARAQVSGAAGHWDRTGETTAARVIDLPLYPFDDQRYWLTGAPAATARTAASPPAAAPSSRPDPRALPRPAIRSLVLRTATELAGAREQADPARSFKDLGLNSAGLVELRNRLAAETGLRLPTSMLFSFPTPGDLADALHARIAAGADPGEDARPAVCAAVSAPSANGSQPSAPVAIVAMGCRYPGTVSSPQELWRLLADGTDAITSLPTNRGWDLDELLGATSGDGRPGTSQTRSGGFLHDADTFDAEFFGLSPREALAMDPQQRLLLEVSWEAIERAGMDPTRLAGSPTGIFAGLMAADYGPRLHQPSNAGGGHLLTGTLPSVASGRIAYTFGLRGPALTVDTACSSSLVAVHLAVQSLRRGECALALAGGVTVMSNPGNLVEFSRQNGLAPDGRAKAFADGADGTAFAEGAGVLLLERLDDAIREGHPVLAVIRGTAVNSDGASNGLSAPNGLAQEQVIRDALADAGVPAGSVDAVEAHGTGTALGDPVEAHALLATYGQRDPAAPPAWLGSLKSNIGHTQAAAGVGGIIKMVLALRHELLPRTLHADQPTRRVDWSGDRVRLLARPQPWPAGSRPRRAAVSSFGISGTNAHLVLEEAGAPAPSPAGGPAGLVRGQTLTWVLSAKSDPALRTLATRMNAHATAASDADLTATGPSLARRASFPHRAVVLAGDRAELCAALAALAAGTPHPAVVCGLAQREVTPVFVFPGQGAQWAGMGAGLLDGSEPFAAELRRCAAALQPHVRWPVLDVLAGVPGAADLNRTDVVQPALFAMMVALAALWRSAGVEPAAVIGHSQGEIAAASVAGALPLADAARLVALRSQVTGQLDGTGAVLSVGWPAIRVRREITPWAGRLWVAADNGPIGTVVAGDVAAIEELSATLGDRVQVRRTPVAYAAHTPHVAAVREELLARLGELAPAEAGPGFCSSLAGGFIAGTELDSDYWYRNLAQEVRFDTALRSFGEWENPLFIEVSPHPVLTAAIAEILADAGTDGAGTATLRRDAGGPGQFLAALAAAYVRGAPVSWPSVLGPAVPAVELPSYPFAGQRFWLSGDGADAPSHPLLRSRTAVAETGGLLLAGRLSRNIAPWLADHVVDGTVLVPGTVFLELGLQAAVAAGLAEVTDLTVHAPLALPDGAVVELQVTVGADEAGGRPLRIYSRPAPHAGDDNSPAEWTQHATGTAGPASGTAAGDEAGDWPPRDAAPVDLDAAYRLLAARGYDYGPAFRGLEAAWQQGPDVYADVRLTPPLADRDDEFLIHPALLDAALHPALLPAELPAGAPEADGAAPEAALLPFAWSGAWLRAHRPERVRVRVTARSRTEAAVTIYDRGGAPIGGIESLVLRPATPAGDTAAATRAGGLYQIDWIDPGLAPGTGDRQWAVVGDGPAGGGLSPEVLAASGIAVRRFPRLDAPHLDAPPDAVPAVVLAPRAGEDGDDPGRARQAVSDTLALVRQWADDPRFARSRLVIAADRRTVSGAAVWGLVRSAQTEHPGRFVLISLRAAASPATVRSLAAVLDADEPQAELNGGQILVPRLAAASAAGGAPAEPSGATTADLADGTVLITGGTGGLGALTAEHLVAAHGVRDLLLVSRRGAAAPAAADLRERLVQAGATVRLAACDVADRSALSALLRTLDRPLTGVVHAAGALADATVARLTARQLEAALRPKLDGGWLLHELTAGQPLRAFVLFSSVAGILGNAGQGAYAAANASLDALAAHRQAHGLPAVSVAWGLWDLPTAMTAAMSGSDRARLAAAGLVPLAADEGLAALDRALAQPPADGSPLVACRLDLPRLRSRAGAGGDIAPPLRRLARPARPGVPGPRASGESPEPGGRTAPPLAAQLGPLSRAEAAEAITTLVQEQVAGSLGHRPGVTLDASRPLSELGMDSLASVELRNRLGSELGLRLPASLVFDHPTITALAGHLLDQLRPQAAAEQAARAGSAPDAGQPPWQSGTSDEDLFAFIDTQLRARDDEARRA